MFERAVANGKAYYARREREREELLEKLEQVWRQNLSCVKSFLRSARKRLKMRGNERAKSRSVARAKLTVVYRRDSAALKQKILPARYDEDRSSSKAAKSEAL